MSQLSVQQAFDRAVREQNAGRLREAEEIYQQVLAVQPNHSAALQNLGFLAYQSGRASLAVDLLRRAVAAGPPDAKLLSNLGSVLVVAGQLESAVQAFERAAALMPESAQIHSNLGNALAALGQTERAIAEHEKALALNPDSPDAHNNLGTVLSGLGRRDPAIAHLQRAVALRPQFVQGWNNLGTAFREAGDLDESIAACRQALAVDPRFLPAWHNLGSTFRDAGQLDEAIACYRKAAETHQNPAAVDDLLLALLLHPTVDPAQIRDEHARWNQIYARPLAPAVAVHRNERSLQKRLRIGYVSPDFRHHPVGRFFLPLIANHNRAAFEIFCYSDTSQPDDLTAQIQAHAHQWRKVQGMSNEQLVALVVQDQIDILVDLAMHTRNNRLLAFAQKPAPVQVTYLAYPGTTALETMDYRLTDPHLDPTDEQQSFYAEKSIRLPRTFWCYAPSPLALAVHPLPATQTGHVTFGCLNMYSKVTPPMLALWAGILREIPGSRFILHSFRGSHRQRVLEIFSSHGVDPDRLQFVDRVSTADYFARYNEIDIALDTHPYPGGTTTCDALWMGVPVVTLAGATALSRGGLSILTNVGLAELIAHDPQQYSNIAMRLASDLPALANLRATLRDRMAASALMDAPTFAGDVENAFCRMWAG